MKQKVIITDDVANELDAFLKHSSYDKLVFLSDENTYNCCMPVLAGLDSVNGASQITIKPDDQNKNIDSLCLVWQKLSDSNSTRHTLLVNLGGGMITDLGGFAASTFKRGICFINIPTTLLAMVDASAGGKTGINFNGLKNEIGVFNEAASVLIDTVFLKSLDSRNLCSGYAEMLKHSLISQQAMWEKHLQFDILSPDYSELLSMIEESVRVKEHIVTKDPYETGIRKALNLGHTIGHAFEAFALKTGNPVLHGYAVAYGLICELYLSVVLQGFPVDKFRQTVRYINECYGKMAITCDDYDELLSLMQHDKKNVGSEINFTLLHDVGDIRINQTAPKELIREALDFYREN